MVEAAFNCLAVSAFAMAFSLPVGRALLAAALILLCIDCYKRRSFPEITGVMWMSVVFLLIAFIATLQGANPAGWIKLRKLVWYVIGIFTYASLVSSKWRLNVTLKAFAAGTGVLAVCNLITQPVAAVKASNESISFFHALMNAGSMTDAQRFVAGIIVTLISIVICRKTGRRCTIWGILLFLQSLALLITFKRGSWICLILAVGAILMVKASWRYVAGLAAVVLVLALLPPVRGRLADLRTEFDTGKGGRLTMWFKIAPVLSRQHPWLGIGWRAMTNEMMAEVAPNVEKNRNHLHSNIAEILVETGWIGLVVYIAWMVKAVWDTAGFYLGAGRKAVEDAFNSLSLLCVLCALLLNGLIEFNFADGELVLIYCMVMGCAAAGIRRLEFRPLGVRLQVH